MKRNAADDKIIFSPLWEFAECKLVRYEKALPCDPRLITMTTEEHSLLETLDGIVRAEEVRSQLRPIVDRVHAALTRKTDVLMSWEPLSLELFGNRLPAGIKSAWVFILRAGADRMWFCRIPFPPGCERCVH